MHPASHCRRFDNLERLARDSSARRSPACGDDVDQSGTEVWEVSDGWDLDQYLFRAGSPLNFAIDVDRGFGPVDADGHPTAGNALFGLTGRLTLRVFDVDDDAPVGLDQMIVAHRDYP